MSEALLLTCAKCGTRVRLREGDDLARCEACNALTLRPTPGAAATAENQPPLSLRLVLIGSLLLVAAGAFLMHSLRTGGGDSSASAAPPIIYTAPPEPSQEAAPAGEIAWEPEARAPVLLPRSSGDGEDFFGFFRVWDGRSAWVAYGGVFDGTTLASSWRTEAIDPQLVKREGVVPLAAVAGSRIVVSDTTPTLRVFDVTSGSKLATLGVADAVVEICKPKDAAPRVWVRVVNQQNALIDLESMKATFAPRPAWCAAEPATSAKKPAPTAPAGACHEDFQNRLAQASCLTGEDAPPLGEGTETRYLLKDGASAVALGIKDGRPVAVGVGAGFKSSWVAPLVADETKPLPEAPHVAELTDGKLYVVYGKVYFDARVAAFDADSGKRLWDVPLVGSLSSGTVGDHGRGGARGLVASKRRVYVTRSGGGLDVFDAADGKTLGTVGRK
jgi:hypothetical protein